MRSYLALLLACALPLTASACKPKEAAGATAEPRPSALPVDVIVMEPKPVRDTSEFLATLSSRSSVSLYPQVVGHVSRILVKPGARVQAGAALVQIDPSQQQALLDQLVAMKRLKEASLRNADQKARRSTTLFKGGFVSPQDNDQATSDRDVAAADVNATEAQIKAQASQLRFYVVTAPFAGTVGDVPVKLGDLVTTTTKVTTVDESGALEAYVNVPVERAKDLSPGSRVELLDAAGALLGESPVTFIADQANPDTQSVLIKGLFPNAAALRALQYVRARVVWSTRPGLRLPTTAVVRQSGQTFVFVTEGDVAKQRAVTLGAIEANEYVVTAGLAPGERVIGSSVQKLREGAPVAPKT